MATNVHLSSELERFARDCVETGTYNNVSEVVRAALRLLQEQRLRREQFGRMLLAAEAECDRDGSFSVEDMRAETDALIVAHSH